uniref:Methylcytosine dioxygenase TET n=1 Tax=Callorhinchus milii TaxID=7868 RepID=A0A4W3HXC5_CALMI
MEEGISNQDEEHGLEQSTRPFPGHRLHTEEEVTTAERDECTEGQIQSLHVNGDICKTFTAELDNLTKNEDVDFSIIDSDSSPKAQTLFAHPFSNVAKHIINSLNESSLPLKKFDLGESLDLVTNKTEYFCNSTHPLNNTIKLNNDLSTLVSVVSYAQSESGRSLSVEKESTSCNCEGLDCPDYQNVVDESAKTMCEEGRTASPFLRKDTCVENGALHKSSTLYEYSPSILSMVKKKNISIQQAIAIEALTQLSVTPPQILAEVSKPTIEIRERFVSSSPSVCEQKCFSSSLGQSLPMEANEPHQQQQLQQQNEQQQKSNGTLPPESRLTYQLSPLCQPNSIDNPVESEHEPRETHPSKPNISPLEILLEAISYPGISVNHTEMVNSAHLEEKKVNGNCQFFPNLSSDLPNNINYSTLTTQSLEFSDRENCDVENGKVSKCLITGVRNKAEEEAAAQLTQLAAIIESQQYCQNWLKHKECKDVLHDDVHQKGWPKQKKMFLQHQQRVPVLPKQLTLALQRKNKAPSHKHNQTPQATSRMQPYKQRQQKQPKQGHQLTQQPNQATSFRQQEQQCLGHLHQQNQNLEKFRKYSDVQCQQQIQDANLNQEIHQQIQPESSEMQSYSNPPQMSQEKGEVMQSVSQEKQCFPTDSLPSNSFRTHSPHSPSMSSSQCTAKETDTPKWTCAETVLPCSCPNEVNSYNQSILTKVKSLKQSKSNSDNISELQAQYNCISQVRPSGETTHREDVLENPNKQDAEKGQVDLEGDLPLNRPSTQQGQSNLRATDQQSASVSIEAQIAPTIHQSSSSSEGLSVFTSKSPRCIKVETSGCVTVLSTSNLNTEDNQSGSFGQTTPTKSNAPSQATTLNSFLESPMKFLDTPTKKLLDTPSKKGQSEFPMCDCVEQIIEKDEGPYYTHLGAGPNVAAVREMIEDRYGEKGKAIRIEVVIYTGKEGKSSQGCPIAKWVIRRSNEEEKLLCLVRQRAGHRCQTAVIVILILAWEGIPRTLADKLYQELTQTLRKYGSPTNRRCALNEDRTCACQGLDPERSGASFSFGCSWSMYYNGCKFARSKYPRKFKLLTDDIKEEEMLESYLQELASDVAPVYQKLAPEAYGNQIMNENIASNCRLGLKSGRPFSGVTACIDFCAHSHKDQHNMRNGSTVVCTLTKEDNRTVNSIPEDEQLHVLPLYKISHADEYGNEDIQEEKMKNGAIQVLSSFPREVRILAEPVKSARKKKLEAKRAALDKQEKKHSTSGKLKEGAADKHCSAIHQCSAASSSMKTRPQDHYNSFKYTGHTGVGNYSPLGGFTSPAPYNLGGVYPYSTLIPRPNLPTLPSFQHSFSVPYGYLGYPGNQHFLSPFTKYNNVEMMINGFSGSALDDKKADIPQLLPNMNFSVQQGRTDSLDQIYKNATQFTQQRKPQAIKEQTSHSQLPGSCDNMSLSLETKTTDTSKPNGLVKLQLGGNFREFQQSFTQDESLIPPKAENNEEPTPMGTSEKPVQEVWSDSEHNFLDEDIGGVAVAPSHGSVLIECARHELHATTPVKKPNRHHPTRISLVFYQHKNLHEPKHGLALWEAKLTKMAERAKEKEKEEVNHEHNLTKPNKKFKRAVPQPPELLQEDNELVRVPTRKALSTPRDSVITVSSYALTQVTGPYSRWI